MSAKTLWVACDMPDRLPELLAAAKSLGEKVNVLVAGSEDDARKALALGATEVHLATADTGPNALIFEDYAPTFVDAITKSGNPALVLLPSTRRGKALAARMGVALNAAVVNEAATIAYDGDALVVGHMVYGGLAQGVERIASASAVVTVGNMGLEPVAPAAPSSVIVPLEINRPEKPIRCVSRHAKQGSQVNLGKARRVVCVGRGLGSKEGLAVAEQLATAIGAELGCSRPVAEGENWMERERYVGVSGVMLKADLYLALGVSGQIQHMVGANVCKVIVAVNKDKNAPIFQYADYGIVGDLHKVTPALAAALK